MVNRLCAAARPCAAAIAIDPSVGPAQNASSSRCFCSSSAILSLLTHGACRACGPVPPLLFPAASGPAAPLRRRRVHSSARTAGVSGSHRKPDGGVVECGAHFWKDFMRLQQQRKGFFSMTVTKVFAEREKFSSRGAIDHRFPNLSMPRSHKHY